MSARVIKCHINSTVLVNSTFNLNQLSQFVNQLSMSSAQLISRLLRLLILSFTDFNLLFFSLTQTAWCDDAEEWREESLMSAHPRINGDEFNFSLKTIIMQTQQFLQKSQSQQLEAFLKRRKTFKFTLEVIRAYLHDSWHLMTEM